MAQLKYIVDSNTGRVNKVGRSCTLALQADYINSKTLIEIARAKSLMKSL